MKRIVAVLVLAVVVTLAGCTTQSPNGEVSDQTPAPSTDTSQTGDTADHTVQYTADGFSPETITIQQGESVTWVSDGASMWVATDRHPSHTEYDGTSTSEHCNDESSTTFDQCGTGQQYTFTFDKTGTWTYHNHRLAGHTGTVVVE